MLRGFSTWDQREGNEMRLECQEMIHNTVSVLSIMTTLYKTGHVEPEASITNKYSAWNVLTDEVSIWQDCSV